MNVRLLDRVLVRSPVQPLFRLSAARRVTILAYHGVTDEVRFEQQMELLSARLSPVSLESVLDAMAGEVDLPRHAVLVTFDDADRSVFDAGLPILKKYDIPAVVFAVAGLIGSRRPFWWHEVEELVRRGATSPSLNGTSPEACVRELKQVADDRRRTVIDELRSAGFAPVEQSQLTADELRQFTSAGIAVGNHTLTHPCMDRCSSERTEYEVVRAHELLAGMLGRPPRVFAWPNGNVDSRAIATLTRLGYEAAFLFDHRTGRFPPSNRFSISRLRVNSDTTMDRFRLILSGFHARLHHAIGRA